MTTGILAWRAWSTVEDGCDLNTGMCDSQSELDAEQRGSRYALIANIAGTVGAIGLGTGVYLVLTSESPDGDPAGATDPQGGSPKPATGPVAQLELGSFSGYHGLRMTGQF
jgi:hypothetical protein